MTARAPARGSFAWWGALVVCACAPAAPARAPGAIVRPANLSFAPGATLEQACTPTGPELCFNAIDDNCNGVIDEGCGVRTGLLQFTIAWPGTADVNLMVETPAHERVPSGSEHSTPSGFHLDRDCPGDDGCQGQNVENISYEGPDPPRGHYEVQVVLVNLHGADPPVTVRFGARLGSRSLGYELSLGTDEESSKRALSFDLP